MSTDLLLVDLSALVHANYHALTNDPNPDATSIKTVERVRALASGMPFVGIACDTPSPSFRKEIDPNYKANRKAEDRAPLYHQLRLTIETLRADGFPCFEVPGFEADDIIATACKHACMKPRGLDRVVIATSDKDLAPLVREPQGIDDGFNTPEIVIKSLKDGSIIDVDGVKTKFKGIAPTQVVDWLTLVGDSSDNVPGCNSIGEVWASALLQEFGTLENVYKAIDKGLTPTITPSRRSKLQEFRAQWPITRSLIQLRFDVPINIEAVFQPRIAQNDVAVFGDEAPSDDSRSTSRDESGASRVAPSGGDSAQPLSFTASSGATPLVPKAEESGHPSFTYEDALAEMDAAMPARPAADVANGGRDAHSPDAGPVVAGNGATTVQKPAFADAVAGVKPETRACPAIHKETGAECELPFGHAQNHRGVFKHGTVQWPDAIPGLPVSTPTSPARAEQKAERESVALEARPPARDAELVDYERQLEPRSLAEAYKLATSMFQARLFSAYGNADAVLSTILAGREFGMPAMASLRAMHIVEGKPTLAADTIRALVLRSGAAEYFRCSERTPERATFVTKRKGEPEQSLTYTLAEGRIAFAGDDAKFAKSGWGRNSADMCVARAGAKLARLVYPDVVHGLFAKEEFEQ